jgi:hypothetical protein
MIVEAVCEADSMLMEEYNPVYREELEKAEVGLGETYTYSEADR